MSVTRRATSTKRRVAARTKHVSTVFQLHLSFVLYLFLFFSGLLVYLSFRSFLGGVAYLAFFRGELAKVPSTSTPFVTIIAPCKGLDEGLRENLTALLEIDYPEYEVIFVVNGGDDPAVPIINELVKNGAFVPERRLVNAEDSRDSGQKVENILAATTFAAEESLIFIFIDSDVRPQEHWLKHLVAPLENDEVGAATGYRWFLSKQPSFASELRSAWNASIASALGPNTNSNFCWGGSMAIRREVWEALDLRERLRGTLSDDFTVTRAMNDANLEIRFVAQALTPSIENCTIKELFEFTTRQMKITRVYKTELWALSFFGSGLFCLVMLSAFLIVFFSDSNDALVLSAIANLFLVSVLSIGKAWLRLKAVSLVIPIASEQLIPQMTLWLLAPPIFLLNCLAALFSRTINWRGVRYRLVSATETERLN